MPAGVDPISRIWRFTESSVTPIADAISRSLLERLSLEEGVFRAINWCLYEIMDNVLQHAESEVGFVEAQVHQASKRVAICIADAGVGFKQSFRNSRHRPGTESDAITLSVQENFTRDSQVGAGNGLWGLYQIVTKNDGLLSIQSGRGSLRVRQGPWTGQSTSFSESHDSRIRIADGHGTDRTQSCEKRTGRWCWTSMAWIDVGGRSRHGTSRRNHRVLRVGEPRQPLYRCNLACAGCGNDPARSWNRFGWRTWTL